MKTFPTGRDQAFTLVELMIALTVGSVVAGAAVILYLFIYQGMYETSAKLVAQRKADMMVEKITRGPMGCFGGIHSVYYWANGTAGAPNPTITTVSTSPTNQTFSFYVQTNFTGFTYINMTNYLNTAVAARYTIGYNSTNKTVYYTVGSGSQSEMIVGFPDRVTMGRFMFTETGTNAMVKLTFDLLIQKANRTVLTNTYEANAFYRNNPLE